MCHSECLSTAELSPKTVAKAFWRGEVENELRRIGKLDYTFFKDADFNNCMGMIDTERQNSLYPHLSSDCTDDCKSRGISRT